MNDEKRESRRPADVIMCCLAGIVGFSLTVPGIGMLFNHQYRARTGWAFVVPGIIFWAAAIHELAFGLPGRDAFLAGEKHMLKWAVILGVSCWLYWGIDHGF